MRQKSWVRDGITNLGAGPSHRRQLPDRTTEGHFSVIVGIVKVGDDTDLGNDRI